MKRLKSLFLLKPGVWCLGLSLLYLMRKTPNLWACWPLMFRAMGLYRRWSPHAPYRITYTGVLILLGPRHVLKIPLSPAARADLGRAYANDRLLRQTALGRYLPYLLRPVGGGAYMMSHLENCPHAEEKAREILEELRALTPSSGRLSFQEIGAGAVEKNPALQPLAQALDAGQSWPRGAMHGDLTPPNILQMPDGRVAMIDLDRFTLEGSPRFDELHLELETEAKRRQVRFLTVLEEKLATLTNPHERQEWMAYFLYRMSLETRPENGPNRHEARAMASLVEAFLRPATHGAPAPHGEVLLISDHYDFGGVATVHAHLAKGFAALGYRPILVGAFVHRIGKPLPPEIAYECLHSAAWERKLVVPYILRLALFLRRHRNAVLLISAKDHVNMFVICAKILARVRGKLICNSHNTVSELAKNLAWRGHTLMLTLCRRVYPWADFIVNVSQASARDSESFFGLPKVHYLPNPVLERLEDTPFPNPFPEGETHLVACGRLAPSKDFALLLKACAVAFPKAPHLHLTLLGDGPERANLERLAAELNLGPRVTFAGFVENPRPYMAHAAAVCLTSAYEGFGMVLVEALAQGCPVLAVDCPHGPAEIIGNNTYGRLVTSRRPEDVAENILELLATPRKDRSFYRKRALDFSTETCTGAYLELAGLPS